MARWTKEDIEYLKIELDKGSKYKDIAKVLGRTKDAVRKKTYSLGLKSKFTDRKPESTFEEEFNNTYEGFYYIGGYTNNVSSFELGCKECGSSFERNASVLRGYDNIKCWTCIEKAREEKETRVSKNRTLLKLKKKLSKLVVKREHEESLKNHVCKECSITFTATHRGAMYCGQACRDRVNDRTKKHRRRLRIERNGKVDTIQLGELIERDSNVCYLCGESCDRGDYIVTDEGHFITGSTYPSIDHVIPVSKGGTHTWGNVRLAHHQCNSIKNDSLIKELTLAE